VKRGDDQNAVNLSRFLIGSATFKDIRLTVEELTEDPYITRGDADNLLKNIVLELGAGPSHRSALEPVN
jgi:hypothetical protein